MAPIDPDLARRTAWMADLTLEEITPADRARAEESLAPSAAYHLPTVLTEDVMIDGPLGPQSLRVRSYRPEAPHDPALPCLVWVHGGGFVAGTVDDPESDTVAREVCQRAGAVVISVDYHLADEIHGYPTLHEEVVAAYQWTRAQAHSRGVDPARITVGGASAGGNLALMATVLLRDTGEPLPAAQILAYPFLHRSPPSWRTAPDLHGIPPLLRFPPATYDLLYGTYLAHAGQDTRYSSIEGHELTGLPECLIIPAECDDLRASAEAHADAARAAGVRVTEQLAVGMLHGHLSFSPEIGEVDRTLQLIADFVAAAQE